jgi:hypothetical protein
MDGVSIIGVALGVGVVVWALSLRAPDEPVGVNRLPPAPAAARSAIARLRRPSATPSADDLGFGRGPAPLEGGFEAEPDPEPESFVYVPVLHAQGPRWKARIGGVIGLLALITVGALAVAIGIYQLGHALNQMLRGFLGQ